MGFFQNRKFMGVLKEHAAIQKSSIDYNDKGGDRILVMNDLVSVEEAIANGAENLL